MEQLEQVLPPGFRFYPTEEELITFYLYNKLHGHRPDLDRVIPSIDIYNFEPSQLPGLAGEPCKGEMEQWFFFMPQQEKEFRGGRPNRTTATGYWKATGSPCYVYSSSSQSNNKVIGVKKTMVFYKGKAPNGKKTKWKMNEYKAIKQDDNITTNASSYSSSTIPKLKHEFSLCRVYVTTGCARAFDRRPPGPMPNINTQNLTTTNNNQIPQEVPDGTTSSSSQNANATATMSVMERSSSTDSSDSGGNDHTALQTIAASGSATSNKKYDVEMAEALEPFLDWEQLNWL